MQLLDELGREVGEGEEISLLTYVRRMAERGTSAAEAIAALEDLIDVRSVHITHHYGLVVGD